MKRHLFATAPAVMVLAALGCSVAPTDAGEPSDSTHSASTAATGLTASIAVTRSGANYNATMTLKNGSAEPATNWQVLVSFGSPSVNTVWPMWTQQGTAAVNGAEYDDFGSNVLFTPLADHAYIKPGGSVTVTWTGTWNGVTPTIVSVDGVASGAPGAGAPADGIDPIARSAATTALSIAMHYVKDKPANNGDKFYGTYDKTLWTSQSYRVASGGNTIEFDPNAPGYFFVPNSAKAELAFAQLDPMVASYLTAGLVSCFSVTDGQSEYAFRADFLKGFVYPKASSGSVTNSDGTSDSFSVVGSPGNGGERVTVTASSTTDKWFGILEYINATTFPNYWTHVDGKYQGHGANTRTNPSTWHGHQRSGCTPFNGPGGSTNPYFVINQNGASVPAWFSGVGTNCMNGCKGTAVIDPIPYAEPGSYYNTAGMVGAQSNPFVIQSNLYADPAHSYEWATRFANGTQEWGTFSTAVTLFGSTKYKYAKQM
ncbi:MAG: hypothetical protein M3O36_14050 [Myxococcota bacterium]|nr:hypothetical protein [Myxococcota bacterium]